MSFRLGFKANPFLRRHGWKAGAGTDWDREASRAELAFWKEQGFDVVEVLPDHYSQEGDIFAMTDDEWSDTRAVIEDAGLKVEGIMGWRRVFYREPWIAGHVAEMQKIVAIGEALGAAVIDFQPSFTMPLGNTPGGPVRQIFRSLWEATTEDFRSAAAVLKPLARQAADFGAGIALQMHPDGLCDVPQSTIRLLELIDEPNVGINPDTFDNDWLYPEYPRSVVPSAAQQCRLLAPYVNYWHAKNWERTLGPNQLWAFKRTHLDEGMQPISLMVQHLVKTGFAGAVILESGRGFENTVSPAAMLKARDYLTWLRDVYAPRVPVRSNDGPMSPEAGTGTNRLTVATPGT